MEVMGESLLPAGRGLTVGQRRSTGDQVGGFAAAHGGKPPAFRPGLFFFEATPRPEAEPPEFLT
jgi:hypothetical protein